MMVDKKDKKMEEIIVEVLEEYNKFSTNISSETSREIIAKAVIRKIKKMYDYNIKYYYS